MIAENRLGPPQYLGTALTTARNRVFRVGIELEGGWKSLPPGTNLVRDGSIHFNVEAPGLTQIGELPSRPLPVRDYPLWMQTYYPHFVNASCGLHVHLSFHSSFPYHKLMVNTYPSTLLMYVNQWAIHHSYPKTHPIWPRLRGDNEYCQHTFYADIQARRSQKDYDRHRIGNRYSVVNYCHSLHGTLESRLLPMFDTVAEAIAAVELTIRVTNAFLAISGKREKKMEGGYVVDDERLIDKRKGFV